MRRVLGTAIGTALGLLTLTAPASAQFLTFVSAAGNDANSCFVQAAPCKTLQRAINQTSAGGELRLLTSLTSNGFINKSITVEGGYNTVIGTIVVNSATAIVRFQRLNLNGVNGFPTGFNLVNAAAVHIEKCSAERYTTDGIALAPNISTELVISNSVSRDNGQRGLDVGDPTSAKVTVEGSRFENGANFGIRASGHAAISRSILFGNFVGINVLSGTANVAETTAAGNGDVGFVLSGGSLTLSSCDAEQNTNGGLLVGSGPIARISDCVFTENGIGVQVLGAGVVSTLGNNIIAGNTTNLSGTLTPLAGE
jgi:hypothetical protein